LRVGGLRAGTLSLSRSGLRLRGYSLVEGITVSGTMPGTLTVAGPAAAPARLRLRGTRLTGVIGTDRVRLRVALPEG
jgi:hypothetical protein